MPFEIRPIEHKFYPLEQATQKAAEQNAYRDYRLGIISSDTFTDLSEVDQKKYLDEAARVLLEYGVNYIPTAPVVERIHVAKEVFLNYDEALRKIAWTQVKYWREHAGLKVPDFNDMSEEEKEKYLETARMTLVRNGKFFIEGFSTEIIYAK
ncbi:hypothetical protein AVU38_gp136 [Ralstonia phage RSL2]|uniref:Uncharacterized protein n=1 Tax=Ralstonia phage RSL2 TaxID=1585840 RepID=A0A0A8J9I6_9CAUD|nr:hypothetical protein AVU38_gp136 [Ralstonia phage RSL2]BAQ02664.1 hypothetical protein [Ralstonia phage RSL2]